MKGFYMIVLGIDPGYAIVGYGILDFKSGHFKILDFGSVETSADENFTDRISKIYESIKFLIKKYKVSEVAVEELFFNKNSKTAIMVAEARGVILLAAKNAGAEIYEYTPLQVKQGICGYGAAPKAQVERMVKLILNLKETPKPDDTADALAIAISHCNTCKLSSLFKVK